MTKRENILMFKVLKMHKIVYRHEHIKFDDVINNQILLTVVEQLQNFRMSKKARASNEWASQLLCV